MIQQVFHRVILNLLFACISFAGFSQSSIKVSATVDKNRILIGEHFKLTLKADIPENEAIAFYSIDTIPHFEFLEKRPIDTVNTPGGTLLSQEIRLTSFDSGQWVIPSFVLAEKVATDSIRMDVVFSSPFDPNQEYHDIKDVLDVVLVSEEEWWWYVIGAAAILLVLLIFWLTRKPPPEKKIVKPPKDPYETAMKSLEILNQNKPQTKEYYTQLVDVFRVYMLERKGISSLQKTTDDLVVQLKSLPFFSKEQFDRLAQSLRLSDFVKFAKYRPSPEDDREVMKVIKDSITIIQKTEPETTKEHA